MRERILRKISSLTLVAFAANLGLVPMVRAEEAESRALRMQGFLKSAGAFPKGWGDTRKSLLTLKQRVKDSRLDLEVNGIDRYREKAKVMLDLERQRLRRASRYLLDNDHRERLVHELRDTGSQELVELANHLDLSMAQAAGSPGAALDNYMGYRMEGYEQAISGLEKPEVEKVMRDTEAAVDDYVAAGGDIRRLDKGLFALADDENDTGKSKLLRWVVGAIAGVGLVIAVFFSLTTMTMTPFLTFMATVVGLLALLGRNGAFQSVFFGNPYGPMPPGGQWGPYNPWNPYWPPQNGGGFQPPNQG